MCDVQDSLRHEYERKQTGKTFSVSVFRFILFSLLSLSLCLLFCVWHEVWVCGWDGIMISLWLRICTPAQIQVGKDDNYSTSALMYAVTVHFYHILAAQRFTFSRSRL